MIDMNVIIANNIITIMKKQNKKQIDLAKNIGISKQCVSKMLNGSRTINAIELNRIATFLNVSMDTLANIPNVINENNIVHAFMGRVASKEEKQALEIADKLSDMILFHKKIRDNGVKSMRVWEE